MFRIVAIAGLAAGLIVMFGTTEASAQGRRMMRRPAMQRPMGTNPGGNQGAMNQELLKRFDKNGNGQLDPDEREAAKKAMENAKSGAGDAKEKITQKFDKDGDGKLSETERAEAKKALEQIKAKKPQ